MIILLSLSIFSCGESLSDKQRKALKDEMNNREVKKIKEEEIVAETFAVGRSLYKNHLLENDSLKRVYKADIYLLQKEESIDNPIDKKLFEAYNYTLTQGGQASDNVQRDESIMVYTKPHIENDMYVGVYVIRIPRKQLILKM